MRFLETIKMCKLVALPVALEVVGAARPRHMQHRLQQLHHSLLRAWQGQQGHWGAEGVVGVLRHLAHQASHHWQYLQNIPALPEPLLDFYR